MAKTPKAPKKPRAPKTPKTRADAPGAAAVQAQQGHNGPPERTADEVQMGFLQHRTAWNEWKAKRAVVDKIEKDTKAALKADGYLVEEMKVADDLSKNAKSELKVTSSVKLRLRVAKWIGHPMGAQMDLFAQPDRTPLADRAYNEGRQASMESKPAKPPHSPETEAYRRYMDGFHEHQATLGNGFKKPEAENGAADGEDPSSGERVSRSEFKKRLSAITEQEPDGAPAQKR